MRICIGFNAVSDPYPAFEVKSDLDPIPNLVLRVLMNIFCKILQLEKISKIANNKNNQSINAPPGPDKSVLTTALHYRQFNAFF